MKKSKITKRSHNAKIKFLYKYFEYYKGSRFRCDFYLEDYDLYVEYFGLKLEKYETKLEFLNNNNINYISSDNIEDMKRKILNYIC